MELQHYIGTASEQEGIFNLKEIENGIIPANPPVVLEGKAKTYILGSIEGKTGFYQMAEDNRTSPANKACWVLPETAQEVRFNK